jgi:hypothetical protein
MSDNGPSFREGIGYIFALGIVIVLLSIFANTNEGGAMGLFAGIVGAAFLLLTFGWLPMKLDERDRKKKGLPPRKPTEFDTRDPGDSGPD